MILKSLKVRENHYLVVLYGFESGFESGYLVTYMGLNLVVPYTTRMKTNASLRSDRIEPYRQNSAAHRRGFPNVGVQFTSKDYVRSRNEFSKLGWFQDHVRGCKHEELTAYG